MANNCPRTPPRARTILRRKICSSSPSISRTARRKTQGNSRFSTLPAAAATFCCTASTFCSLSNEEAYADPDLGLALKKDYPTLDALKRDVPRLILAHKPARHRHRPAGQPDCRPCSMAALPAGISGKWDSRKIRPKITRSNFVCAEPIAWRIDDVACSSSASLSRKSLAKSWKSFSKK